MSTNKIILALGAIVLAIVAIAMVPTKNGTPTAIFDDSSRVAILTVSSVNETGALYSAGSKMIQWETSGFAANQNVDINLLRKVSNSPAEYVFIRKIASNTKNDGQEMWLPVAGENLENTYIEVTCTSNVGTTGCFIDSTPIKTS